MVSAELLRRYPFFADFSMEQLVTLAKSASQKSVAQDQYIFYEGEELHHFFIVVDGKIAILIGYPDLTVKQPVNRPITGKIIETQTVVSTVGPGEVFGWSGMVAPHAATSAAKALAESQIVSFDCLELQKALEADCQFAFLMMQKMAQVVRDRLKDMRIESLSLLVPHTG